MNAIENTFKLVKTKRIDALNVEYQEYEHVHTQARHIHLASDNKENVFMVALRTVPTDSTGVAHILEHTSLCGSKKYPVRDPFFMMIRRSLNTFMNAFTSSDWTAYPFASQNPKDFDNLLTVYLDAVFFARLDELDFSQEGHRLEFEVADDPESALQFKGVVFNEMKGAMSSIHSQLWQAVSTSLFPDTTYRFNSGGDPAAIPDLSYEQLKAFYQTHYHPDNAVFITYGDMTAYAHQQKFEQLALQQFKPLEGKVEVPLQAAFNQPQHHVGQYQLAEGEDPGNSTHQLMAWVVGDILDPTDVMLNHLMTSILLENSASPLQQALETSELGSSPSPLCGMDDSSRQLVFVCGLQGCAADSTAAFETLIKDTLQNVIDNGIDQTQLEALLDQLELQQREVRGDSYPYGLQIMLSCLATAMHRGNSEEALDIDPILKQLREDIKRPDFVAELIKRKLLDNPHKATITLNPDANFDDQLREKETERLQEIRGTLAEGDIEKIIKTSQALKQRQEAVDDPELLPKVELSDVPDDIDIPLSTVDSKGKVKLSFYPQGTNGITYRQLVCPLPALNAEELNILNIHNRVLTEVGIGGLDYLQTQNRQTKVCGGLQAYSSIRNSRNSEQEASGFFVLSSKGLTSHSDKIDELLYDTFTSVSFAEQQRIAELITQSANAAEHSITGSGHSLAMSIACQGMSPAAKLSHGSSGVLGIQKLKALDKSLQESKYRDALSEQLAALQQKLTTNGLELLAIDEQAQLETIQRKREALWLDPQQTGSHLTLEPQREQTRELWLCNTQVNFCAKAYPTVSSSHSDAPALTVLAGVLRNGFLHTAIREKGGAYGGGASQDSANAAFRFYSYRDPRLAQTLDDFDHSIEWLLGNDLEWRLVEEAILGTVSSLDKPSSPSGTAKQHFHNLIHGRTPEHHREFRSAVLAVTTDDLKRVATTYFDPANASVGVITHKGEAESYEPLCELMDIRVQQL